MRICGATPARVAPRRADEIEEAKKVVGRLRGDLFLFFIFFCDRQPAGQLRMEGCSMYDTVTYIHLRYLISRLDG